MAYNFLDTPTVEEFGSNTELVAELAAAARELNKVLGKHDSDFYHEVMKKHMQSDEATELGHVILGDELAGHSSYNFAMIRSDGLVNRLHVQMLRLRQAA